MSNLKRIWSNDGSSDFSGSGLSIRFVGGARHRDGQEAKFSISLTNSGTAYPEYEMDLKFFRKKRLPRNMLGTLEINVGK